MGWASWNTGATGIKVVDIACACGAAALICYRRLGGAANSHDTEEARINAIELSA